MMTLRIGNKRDELRCQGVSAVTLIELLLVMALLMIVVSVSVPALASFFRGRTLDSEARRLLSLTRLGQARAISDGTPMLLWFDPDEKTYGLEEEPGYVEKDPKAQRFSLDPELKFETIEAAPVKTSEDPWARSLQRTVLAESTRKNLVEIRFLPDGYIDLNSPDAIRISDRSGAFLWLAKSTNRLSYELRSEYAR